MKRTEKENLMKRKEEIEKELSHIESELTRVVIEVTTENCSDEKRDQYETEESILKTEYDKLTMERNNIANEIAMLKNFDKVKFLKNFRTLLNKSEVKIGDIEREAGVTAGYVSRLESGKIAADPSVEFVLTAAMMLRVSVERLVSGDFSELSPTETYISNVLNQLITDTQTDKITWYKENVYDLERIGSSYQGDTEHPLFKASYKVGGSGYPEPCGAEYYSRFIESDNLELDGSFYYAKLPQTSQRIYITSLREDLLGQEVHYLEMYLVDHHDNVKPVCADSVCCECLRREMAILYREIELASSHLHIDDTVRDIFDSYMLKLPFD